MRCRHATGSTPGLAQDISRDGIFFRVAQYIAPETVYAVELDLPGDPAPLTVAVAVCFIGRTLSGFGLGACILESAPEKQRRWQRFYDDALRGRAAAQHAAVEVVAVESCTTPELKEALLDQGLTLQLAADNRAALEQLQPHRRAVVLAELHDPGLGGRELCRLLRQRPGLAGVAAVLVTTSASAADFVAGLEAGAAYVLGRPFCAEYCASRVLAAARCTEPTPAPALDDEEPTRSPADAAAGASFEYLHPPSILPSFLVKAADRISDAFFFTRLAARDQLRRYREIVAERKGRP